ncbi:MAG: DUF4185 domain-containing protein [Mucilaginibacter sp.]
MRNSSKLIIVLSLFCYAYTPTIAQQKTDLEHLNYSVEEAPEWTNLFVRNSGWFGADGIYAIPLDGARSKGGRESSKNMIIFSDSMIGEIKDGKMQPGEKMVHNTVAYLNGDEPLNSNITFSWAENAAGKPESLFIPHTATAKPGDYYWLGDGFVNQATHKTYIFAYRMHNMDSKDDWSFKQMAVDFIVLPKGSKAPFKDQVQMETPLHYESGTNKNSGSFGAGIFVNTKQAGAPHPDGYIYVYGNRGRDLVVSRVRPIDFENFRAWRCWDGKAWNEDIQKAAALTDGISDELSFSPLPDGRYVLVFTLGGMSNEVAMRIAASPIGPFGPVIKLYNAKQTNGKYFHYNAKAHPSLSKPGELLITYNQNSFDFWNQLVLNPNLYHPYFLKLKFK